jgi:transposase
MNLQLSQVLSDVTGETGQRIIRAIVAGERDPRQLAALRNYRCKKDQDEIAQALTGTWREEHLFVLKQSLALYDFYTAQLQLCDDEIERTYSLIRPRWGEPETETRLIQKPGSHSKNAPVGVFVRAHLKRITGVDVVAVHGISASLARDAASRKSARIWRGFRPRRTSAPGWAWPRTTISPGGKC